MCWNGSIVQGIYLLLSFTITKKSVSKITEACHLIT